MKLKEKIGKVKAKYEAYQDKRSYKANERQAKKLQDIRVKRFKAEGKARLLTAEAKERDRIRRANATIAENRPIARAAKKARGFATGLKKVTKGTVKSYKAAGNVNSAAFVSTGNKKISSYENKLSGNVDKSILNINKR